MSTPPTLQSITPKRPSKMASNQSLNHLLNFTLPPRQSRPPTGLPRRSKKSGSHQVWNKERFVNAQYRFVMNPTGDYTVHFADPDIFFQWQDILQVIIPRFSALASAAASREVEGQDEGLTTCPICLSPPTAARMTKCGHVFCFPCILHYLSTSENKWARCPVCFDSVTERQLKCVKWYDGPVETTFESESGTAAGSSSSVRDDALEIAPRAGLNMHMRLMQRPQITTLALPRSCTWPSDLLPPHQAPWHFLPDVFSFAKFMLATPEYLVADLTKDLDELASERRILAGMNDDFGISFIDGADQKVRQQIAKAAALDTPILKEQIEKAHRGQREIQERFAFRQSRKQAEEAARELAQEVPAEFIALKSTAHSIPVTPSQTDPGPKATGPLPRNSPRQRRNINPPPPSTSTYYYYQASSGLPLFLHPLDIKILFSHFSGYASFPDTIDVRVESFSEGTVNDDLRKRCKYLGHLPEGADVVFLEANLEGVVGPEGLKAFEGPLKMRAARRKEKERKDDRARARAEERERDRDLTTASSWRGSTRSSFVVYDEPVREPTPPPDAPAPTPPIPGVWGQRSFASALHSMPSSTRVAQAPRREVVEDEWDVDNAWHELEQRSGGRKKRANKLVVLGSGGGGRRR